MKYLIFVSPQNVLNAQSSTSKGIFMNCIKKKRLFILKIHANKAQRIEMH